MLLVLISLASTTVLADFGDMMGYGMIGGGMFGFGWLISVALISFIFSVVFWLTYKLVLGDKVNHRK